jgi:L-lactate dehydrogenase complex protein LldF
MGLIFNDEGNFHANVMKGINNEFARSATRASQENFNKRRESMKANMDGWDEYKDQAAAIRDDVLSHLDYYLNQFIENAQANGSIVHFAKTDKDAQRIMLDICHEKNAKMIVKTKSMVSEEVDTNHTLLNDGIEVNETDLGEYLIQLDNWNHASHIIAPAMHMDQDSIYELFKEKIGYTGANVATEMTLYARDMLRQKFLTADIGITGCNFGIASTGSTLIITNEGNGRMVTSMPKTQIVIMGMERLLPNMKALDAMMEVFVRHAVGTKVSSYMSITNGPRKEGHQDGPEEVHIILIDNGRSEILASKYKKMLRCIRCGTCQNVCPVFRHITGHGYSTCYMGPMGIVYTPLLAHFDDYTKKMPFACSLCGACTENCPVEIPLHELILEERQDVVEALDTPSKLERGIYTAAGQAIAHHTTFAKGTKYAANPGVKVIAKLTGGDKINQKDKIPVLRNWTDARNLPLMRAGEFRKWVKDHKKEDK